MPLTARLLTLLAVIFLAPACSYYIGPGSHAAPRADAPAAAPAAASRAPAAPASPAAPAPLSPDALQLSPRRLVGRILTVDTTRGFAFVTLAAEAPSAAVAEGAELIARTDDLRETARLEASRYTRGRTLGTKILRGQPSPGDEVVFQAP